MNGNKLKIIACLSMLIDHIGYLLCPKISVLRYIGRIAMPLFAFLIAEGCRYTRSKPRYFLNVFILAIICQAIYTAEELISGSFYSIYLNILFTFSLSILLCFAVAELKENKNRKLGIIKFFCAVLLVVFVCIFLEKLLPIPFIIDYGLVGAMLPVTAMLFSGRIAKALCFSAGIIIYCLANCQSMPYVWCSLLALPLIFAYNGKRGNTKFKYGFYLFYPLHLAVIYVAQMLFF